MKSSFRASASEPPAPAGSQLSSSYHTKESLVFTARVGAHGLERLGFKVNGVGLRVGVQG